MTITKVINSCSVSKLKQKATALKKSSSLSHTEALESVAKRAGFDNWHQVTKANKPMQPIEHVFKHGLIAIYDSKEGENFHDENNLFIRNSDGLAEVACRNLLYTRLIHEEDEETGIEYRHSLDEAGLQELYHDIYGWSEFIVYTAPTPPVDIKSALDLLKPCCFFLPDFIIFKGKLVILK